MQSREIQIAAEMGKRNLWFYFLFQFGAWQYCRQRPEDNWVDRRVHKQLMDWLQMHFRRWLNTRATKIEKTHLAVVMMRGGGKSTGVTENAPSWLALQDPNLTVGVSSYNDDKSADFVGVVKRLYEGESVGLFTDSYGRWASDEQEVEWSKNAFVTSARTMKGIREPSFQSTSVRRGATGGRLDVWVGDDLVPAEAAKRSPDAVELARTHMREMWPVVKPNGLILQCLTPQADDDPFDIMTMEEGLKSVAGVTEGLGKQGTDYVLDPEGGRWHMFFMPARDAAGLPTLPGQWSEAALQEYEKNDLIGYITQALCKRVRSKYRRLTPEWCKGLWIRRDEAPLRVNHVLMLDTAFKDQSLIDSGCENAIVHGATTADGSGDVFFFEALHSLTWSSDDFYNHLIDKLIQLSLHPFSQNITVTDDMEVGGKNGNFKEVLLNRCKDRGVKMPNLIQLPRRSPRYKETHVVKFIDYMLQGKVKLVQGGAGLDVLVQQAVRFGSPTMLNDVIDAAKDILAPEVYIPTNANSYGGEQQDTMRAGDRVLRAEAFREAQADRAWRDDQRPFWREWGRG